MERKERETDRFAEIEDRFAGYTVYDVEYEKIGKVDDVLVDENDRPVYVGVKMGFLGRKSTLVPMEIVRVNDKRELVEVARTKAEIKDAPAFDDDEEISPELERRIHSHFGLGAPRAADGGGTRGEDFADRGADREADRSAYMSSAGTRTGGERPASERPAGERAGGERRGAAGPGMTMGDRGSGGESRPHDPSEGGVREREDDLNDTDELRVQRSEEELVAGTREREAGRVSVRKRVRTDRERIRVPKKREEVSVERVPVNEEAPAGARIGEEEVSVPVVEEEVVVGKRAVVKEEIRVRKDVVQDEEVVEEDVRKEEVDIEDTTGRGR